MKSTTPIIRVQKPLTIPEPSARRGVVPAHHGNGEGFFRVKIYVDAIYCGALKIK